MSLTVIQTSNYNNHYLKITCSVNTQQSQRFGGKSVKLLCPPLFFLFMPQVFLPQSLCSWFLLYLEVCFSDFSQGWPLFCSPGLIQPLLRRPSWNTWSKCATQIVLLTPTCLFGDIYHCIYACYYITYLLMVYCLTPQL